MKCQHAVVANHLSLVWRFCGALRVDVSGDIIQAGLQRGIWQLDYSSEQLARHSYALDAI